MNYPLTQKCLKIEEIEATILPMLVQLAAGIHTGNMGNTAKHTARMAAETLEEILVTTRPQN